MLLKTYAIKYDLFSKLTRLVLMHYLAKQSLTSRCWWRLYFVISFYKCNVVLVYTAFVSDITQ